jgi:hypothetical protein
LLKLRRENGLLTAPFVIQDTRLRHAFNANIYDDWWPLSWLGMQDNGDNAWDRLPDNAEITLTR